MSLLDLLWLAAAATAGLLYWHGNQPRAGWIATAAYAAQLLILAIMGTQLQGAAASAASFSFTVLNHTLHWQMTGFGWFFALITAGAALFASWFSAGEWGERQGAMRLQHVSLALNVAGMYVLLASADFLSLFIGWELVSWATYLIMTQRGGKAADAALRYLIYAMGGAMAILAAIGLIHVHLGSFDFAPFWDGLPRLRAGLAWVIVLLLAGGFLVKMAVMPFHLWQADAYSETPGAGSAFLNAISARMGLFAVGLVLLAPPALDFLNEMDVPFTFLDGASLLAWLGAITAIVPTYIALQQTDARWLLTWHGIGQGGFMLLGLAVGTEMSIAGGLLHVFNYALYQAALFLSVVAVIHRTGTSDLDRLGGLITRMPLSYVTMLMGIIGLAGLPPLNGFVSKWLVYKSLMDQGMPLLLLAASISTLGTILSVYKLIHNTFLGQLRTEHYEIKEVPWSMTAPMLVLVGLCALFGAMPGLALDLVDKAQAALGFPTLAHHLGGVEWRTGSLNMLWVWAALLFGFGVGAGIFFLGGRRVHVHQWDNYAGGHFLSADVDYQYSHNFYPGLMRVIGPWFLGYIVKLEQGLSNFTQVLAGAFHSLYRVAYTPLYLLLTAVLAMAWMGG